MRIRPRWIVGTRPGTVHTTLTPLGDGAACIDEATYKDARAGALYCVYGMDAAGNPTPVAKIPVGS